MKENFEWAKKVTSFLLNGKRVVILFEEDFDSHDISKFTAKINTSLNELVVKNKV